LLVVTFIVVGFCIAAVQVWFLGLRQGWHLEIRVLVGGGCRRVSAHSSPAPDPSELELFLPSVVGLPSSPVLRLLGNVLPASPGATIWLVVVSTKFASGVPAGALLVALPAVAKAEARGLGLGLPPATTFHALPLGKVAGVGGDVLAGCVGRVEVRSSQFANDDEVLLEVATPRAVLELVSCAADWGAPHTDLVCAGRERVQLQAVGARALPSDERDLGDGDAAYIVVEKIAILVRRPGLPL